MRVDASMPGKGLIVSRPFARYGRAVAKTHPHDPELALLVACAAWPPSPVRAERVRQAASEIDAARFVALVGRHRMAGMAADGVASAGVALPKSADQALRILAREDLLQAMHLTREAGRLIALLEGQGIRAVVLKGPPLALLLYGTLAVRQLRDLDLLVSPEDLPRALELIREQGYALQYRNTDAGMRPDRTAILKDVTLAHPESGAIVELHARLNDNAALLSNAIADGAVPVSIGPGLAVPTLTGASLLLYLAVHGFGHSWHRLKWLVDVAVLVAEMPAADLAAFLEDARRQRLWVVGASTLLVLEEMLALGLPSSVLAEARRSWRTRACTTVALRRLRDAREPDDQPGMTNVTSATMLLASSRPAFLVRELAALMADSPFVMRFGGGKAVVATSMALRPVLFGGRKLGSVWRRRRGAER